MPAMRVLERLGHLRLDHLGRGAGDSVTLTVTTGSSIFGYSRTARRVTAHGRPAGSAATARSRTPAAGSRSRAIAWWSPGLRRPRPPRAAGLLAGRRRLSGRAARSRGRGGNGRAARVAADGTAPHHAAAGRRGSPPAACGSRCTAGPACESSTRTGMPSFWMRCWPGRDNDVAPLQPLDDLDPAGPADADLHLDPLRDPRFAVGPGDQLVDELAAALRHDGFFGDHARSSRSPNTAVTRANMPGRSCSWRLSMQPRTPTERPLASTSGSIACTCAVKRGRAARRRRPSRSAPCAAWSGSVRAGGSRRTARPCPRC